MAKRNIGMVFQSYHLLDDLTVQENIDLPLSYKDIPRRERQSWSPTCWTGSRSWPRKICIRVSFRADNSNSLELPGPSFTSRLYCLPMNLPAIFTPSQAKEIMELFRDLNQKGRRLSK